MVAKFATLESLSFMGAKAYEVNNCEMRLLPTKPLKFGVSREAEGEGFEPPGLSASDFQAQGSPSISVHRYTPAPKYSAFDLTACLSHGVYTRLGWRNGWRSTASMLGSATIWPRRTC